MMLRKMMGENTTVRPLPCPLAVGNNVCTFGRFGAGDGFPNNEVAA